jgi:hypothetical protein
LKEAFAVLLFLDHVIDLVVEIWRRREKETSGLGEDPNPDNGSSTSIIYYYKQFFQLIK